MNTTAAVRRLLALMLVAAMALAACGEDDADETAAEGDTTTSAAEGGEEEGPPEVNPCAPGESGEFQPPTAPAAGATPVTVTAVDFAFQGAEAMAKQGEYGLSLKNDGKELHELVVSRLDDEEKRPIAEILASGEQPKQTRIAHAFACPGKTSEPTAVKIDKPGRYVVLCFIPVGTKPETDPADFEKLEKPHAAEGMIQELTVS